MLDDKKRRASATYRLFERWNVHTALQAVRSRTTAQTQQSSFEDDKERLLREQAAARHRLEALNGQLDAAMQDRDAFELEASKAKRELSLVQEERSVLQVRSQCGKLGCSGHPFAPLLPMCVAGAVSTWHERFNLPAN